MTPDDARALAPALLAAAWRIQAPKSPAKAHPEVGAGRA